MAVCGRWHCAVSGSCSTWLGELWSKAFVSGSRHCDPAIRICKNPVCIFYSIHVCQIYTVFAGMQSDDGSSRTCAGTRCIQRSWRCAYFFYYVSCDAVRSNPQSVLFYQRACKWKCGFCPGLSTVSACKGTCNGVERSAVSY